MQITRGRSPSGAEYSKSTSHTSRNAASGAALVGAATTTLHLAAKAPEHGMIDRVDHFSPERNREEIAKRQGAEVGVAVLPARDERLVTLEALI